MGHPKMFAWIEELLQSGNTDAAFEQLIGGFRREKQYRLIFDARMMKKRLDLGLPLVSLPALGDLQDAVRQPYQDAYIQTAREVGELFLADGDIPGAWTYFRAIGDAKPVIQALETFNVPEPDTPERQDLLSSTVQVAYQEGVHPRKGFELILKYYGICRGITMFSAYPQQEGRDESLRLLVRTLHGELVDNLKRAISNVEGTDPATDSIAELIASRGWLVENNATYTDTSHIVSVLRLSTELKDEDTLRQVVELADYGSRLSSMFQHEDEPPFEEGYEDRLLYLRALLGENVDKAVSHFEEKVARFDSSHYGTRPAEVLIHLLSRVGRYDEAIRVHRRHLADAAPEDPSCPTLLQLCEMSGDFEELKRVALERSDTLSYMAALLQSRSNRAK